MEDQRDNKLNNDEFSRKESIYKIALSSFWLLLVFVYFVTAKERVEKRVAFSGYTMNYLATSDWESMGEGEGREANYRKFELYSMLWCVQNHAVKTTLGLSIYLNTCTLLAFFDILFLMGMINV